MRWIMGGCLRVRERGQFKTKLHSKRAATEEKIRRLQQEGKAGVRYTATISDVRFLVVGLICDVGWLIHLCTGILYFVRYWFHEENSAMRFLDSLSLAALAAVVFGVTVIIYLNRIHEKEIATRLQKNLSFGATIFGGFVNFAFGLPIFVSFKKGIRYSNEEFSHPGGMNLPVTSYAHIVK